MKTLEVAKIAGGMSLWGQPHLASSTPLCRCYSMYLCVMLGRERSGEDQCIIAAPLESVEARCVCTVGPGNRKRVPGKGAMGRQTLASLPVSLRQSSACASHNCPFRASGDLAIPVLSGSCEMTPLSMLRKVWRPCGTSDWPASCQPLLFGATIRLGGEVAWITRGQ